MTPYAYEELKKASMFDTEIIKWKLLIIEGRLVLGEVLFRYSDNLSIALQRKDISASEG